MISAAHCASLGSAEPGGKVLKCVTKPVAGGVGVGVAGVGVGVAGVGVGVAGAGVVVAVWVGVGVAIRVGVGVATNVDVDVGVDVGVTVGLDVGAVVSVEFGEVDEVAVGEAPTRALFVACVTALAEDEPVGEVFAEAAAGASAFGPLAPPLFVGTGRGELIVHETYVSARTIAITRANGACAIAAMRMHQ